LNLGAAYIRCLGASEVSHDKDRNLGRISNAGLADLNDLSRDQLRYWIGSIDKAQGAQRFLIRAYQSRDIVGVELKML
jgi:hypothetical protein